MNEQVDEGLATGERGEDTVGELCPMTAVGTPGRPWALGVGMSKLGLYTGLS